MLGILQAGVRSTAGMAKFTEITSLQVLGFVAAAFLAVVCHAVEFPVSFDANFVVTSNGNHAQVLDGGQVVNLALVEYSSNRSFGPWSTLQPLIFCVIELWRCSENFQSSDRNNLAGIEQEWVAFPRESPFSTKFIRLEVLTIRETLCWRCAAATFASKSSYLFGSIGFNIKLAPGNSAGTVTTFFVSLHTTFSVGV